MHDRPAHPLRLAHALRASGRSPQAGPPRIRWGEGGRAQEAKSSQLDRNELTPETGEPRGAERH
eukprot:4788974-Alexandrium_andersonii.AAC.1